MMSGEEFLVEDIYSSVATMKVLKVCGDMEFNEYDIVRKIRNTIKEFLNKNKDVDYLIVYYFPTPEDMENYAALCFLILDENTKNIDVSNIEVIAKKLRWNADYGFFSDVVKNKTVVDCQLVKEAHTLLQIVEEAYLFIYELGMRTTYETSAEFGTFYEDLENWIMKAEHIDEVHGELEFIVKNYFRNLVRHMNNILSCCLSNIGKKIKEDKDKKWIFDHELANARDEFEVVHHQLLYLIRKNLV